MNKPEHIQWAFCLIKPDAIERGMIGRIFSRIEDAFLQIDMMQMRHKTAAWAEKHYGILNDQPFFPDLVNFMTVRPIIGFVVSGPHAISRLRKLVGDTKSWQAAPGSIRGDWGSFPAMYNLIHVSESQEEAPRELALFVDINTDNVAQEIKDASQTVPE
jgi:nucleoside-diphosphate kinase